MSVEVEKAFDTEEEYLYYNDITDDWLIRANIPHRKQYRTRFAYNGEKEFVTTVNFESNDAAVLFKLKFS